ncbi:MAG: NUDIX hydrolase [Candidatus Neomarinimicrobiota bacterium]
MTRLKENKLSSKKVFKGSLLDIYVDEVQLQNGKRKLREYTKHPGAAAVIPILPDGKIGLIRHYRYPTNQIHIEVPAGKIDPGEDVETTAKRELEEEIGYTPQKLTFLTKINPCTGYSDESIWLYIGEDLVKIDQNTDDDESIEFYPVSFKKAIELVWTGKITDVKTIISIFWLEKLIRNNKVQLS